MSITKLKDVIEDIINENDETAQINFHSYLSEKMKNIINKAAKSNED